MAIKRARTGRRPGPKGNRFPDGTPHHIRIARPLYRRIEKRAKEDRDLVMAAVSVTTAVGILLTEACEARERAVPGRE